jgi:anti-sigma factor RsiW
MNSEQARDSLTELLTEKLPQFAAPLALRRALKASVQESPLPSVDHVMEPNRHRWQWAGAFAIAACMCALIATAMLRAQSRALEVATELADEHVHVLSGAPLSQVTGGLHEVKPWFAGKLDFAPDVSFAGDADFPLVGGAVSQFFDHRAAVFVFHRRLHVISLFVMRAEHVSLKTKGTIRGFHYRSWTAGDEALVAISDLNVDELGTFCERIQRTIR